MILRARRVPTIDNKREVLKLAKAALEIDANELIRLTEEVTSLMSKETGKIGKMQVEGKLATVEPHGEAAVIGDVHGDLESLVHILSDSGFLEKVEMQEDMMLIFLGDYGDRGPNSAEVYYVVLGLKQRFPEKVVLMRGNHEGPEDLLASPHDLPFQFQRRFGDLGGKVYSSVRKLFDQLFNAVLVKDRFVMIHGGFPSGACSVDDLAFAHAKHSQEAFLEEMLWNDPEENITGTFPSPRGAGKLFGSDVTAAFLEMLQVKALVRGHEPCSEGFRLNHDGRVLTLFSRKGEPYFNERAAYLRLNLSFKPKNAEELVSWVRRF
jgi:protein phosphatase